jgi:heme/copper-type cytochrome/quinol oxidase subunit 2
LAEVQLAADLGYGVPWLLGILITSIFVSTGFFVYVVLSTKLDHPILRGRESLKYKLHKYHAERYWAILVAGILVWFWYLGLPWSPPVAFHNATENPQNIHTIGITAGQWFWRLQDLGVGNPQYIHDQSNNPRNIQNNQELSSSNNTTSQTAGLVKVKVGETVRFVAHSIDVNHGFGLLRSAKSMDSPLFQMQVVPGFDNVFYYTFKKAGTYTIRCLEYCGWNHPYMVSQITIEAA